MPEPSYAERVRTLLSEASAGMLSTMSRKREGFPFGSLMPYALDGQGRPLFLISGMAMHTQNLKADPRASLFVAQATAGEDPLGAARATLVGEGRPTPESEIAAARAVYLAAHPNAQYWVDFADFSFFRLEVLEVYYVGGFGVMGWVEAQEYSKALPDPLAPSAAGILAHMNADHVNSMILLAQRHAGLEASEAAMTAVDRLGFHLRLKTAEGMKGIRINFPAEVRSPQETREALVDMVRQARGSV
jgi:putative heme iron utilization protein